MAGSLIPLAFLEAGSKAVVREVHGGRTARKKLSDLGLIREQQVEILQNDRGPIIARVGESRVALGFGMANKVMVKVSG